ncbi:hypothetical protein [Parasitella parasitica]|uniref:Zn(2)-C6 fungal-type domain-containing protein n=1 Tax=Parasitella parasitica TaxID=35722 RepID=A0A0B7N0E0_9FUNG|nr:hypothetical protein [Parasitella parasitica]
MTVPTPTPVLANNVSVVVPGINQNMGVIRAHSTSETPKRNQVKNACTNCQKACKKCDDARPCPRCEKYGIADTCVNSVRKERKKGIKRGPYKRRQKNNGEEKPKDQQQQKQQQQQQQQQPVYQAPVSQPTVIPAVSDVAAVNSAIPAPADFGYPTQLSQYAQGYDSYSYAAVYNTDTSAKDLLPGQYVLPVYSTYPAPILVNGNTTEAQTSTAVDAGATASDSACKANASEGVKNQPLTPVPSTSNSSGTTSPSETHEEDDRFTRLTQLCTAALRENKEAREKAQECSTKTEHSAENLVKEEVQ